jgi:lysophospholipase L1-like esterase
MQSLHRFMTGAWLGMTASALLAGCGPAPRATAPLERIDAATATRDAKADVLWYNARQLTVEGQGWTDTKDPWDRLPARAEKIVRGPVWGLSRSSAGIAARFVTDARSIRARWTLTSANLAMNHMPATGVSGLDLYVRNGERWQWVGVGKPGTGLTHEGVLADSIPPGQHEYALYLPLYNGVKLVEIGVPAAAAVYKAAPRGKPVVVYGTSIVQGGCASRPGMAHVAIVGRRLDCPTINLGFSGNGKMEPEMEKLLAELDPAVFVLDCLPNMTTDMVKQRVEAFVRTLRQAHPAMPIVLVENVPTQSAAFLPGPRSVYTEKNDALRAVYRRLQGSGMRGLSYVPASALFGDDTDATVDGTHPTDLGFERMAAGLEPVLRPLLR